MEQGISAEMKKRFKSKRRKASKKGLGHQASKGHFSTSGDKLLNLLPFRLKGTDGRRHWGVGDTPCTALTEATRS